MFYCIQYAMCGYVGKFYKDVYIGSVCKGFNSNLRGIGAPMIAVAIIAFISYFLHGCCGPALRSRPGTVVPVQVMNFTVLLLLQHCVTVRALLYITVCTTSSCSSVTRDVRSVYVCWLNAAPLDR
jgi:uncharacterized membrane protein YGL010W